MLAMTLVRVGAAVALGSVSLGGAPATALASAGERSMSPRAIARSRPTVRLGPSRFGRILVDNGGRALYLWARDKRGSGRSACGSRCGMVWQFLLVRGKPTAGAGVNGKLLGTIKVKGGREVTYDGWPLYTFASEARLAVIPSGQGNTSFGGVHRAVFADGSPVTPKEHGEEERKVEQENREYVEAAG